MIPNDVAGFINEGLRIADRFVAAYEKEVSRRVKVSAELGEAMGAIAPKLEELFADPPGFPKRRA